MDYTYNYTYTLMFDILFLLLCLVFSLQFELLQNYSAPYLWPAISVASLCFEYCWKLNTVRSQPLKTFFQNLEK